MPRRRNAPSNLLGSHQRCWLWGRNVLVETLTARKWKPLEILVSDALSAAQRSAIEQLASADRIPLQVETNDRLTQLCKSAEHQGHLARMPPFPYDDAEKLLENRPAAPLYLALDGIQDPFNFGSMLRSAEVLGVDAVFLGETRQVAVTSHVARSSAGAVNHVRIARVPDLADWMTRVKSLGIRTVGATEKASDPPDAYDFRQPTMIVLGNEGTGLTPPVLAACDARVGIPQTGCVNSLNAAVAAGILFYEAHRQRHPHATRHPL